MEQAGRIVTAIGKCRDAGISKRRLPAIRDALVAIDARAGPDSDDALAFVTKRLKAAKSNKKITSVGAWLATAIVKQAEEVGKC